MSRPQTRIGLRSNPSIMSQENMMDMNDSYAMSPRKRTGTFSVDHTPKKPHYGDDYNYNANEEEMPQDVYGYPLIFNEEVDETITRLVSAKIRKPVVSETSRAVYERISVLVEKFRSELSNLHTILKAAQEWIVQAANCKVDFYNNIRQLRNDVRLLQHELDVRTKDLSLAKDMASKLQRIATDARSDLNSAQILLVEKDKSIETCYAELEAKYEETMNVLKTSQQDVIALQDQVQDLEDALAKEKHANAMKAEEIVQLTNLAEQLKQEKTSLVHDLQTTKTSLVETQKDLQSVDKEKDRVSMELANTKTMLENVRERLSQYEQNSSEERNKNSSIVQERDEYRVKSVELATKLEYVEKTHNSLSQEVQELRSKVNELSRELISEQKQKDFEATLRQKVEQELVTTQDKLKTITEQYSVVQNELTNIRNDLMQERKEFMEMKEQYRAESLRERDECMRKVREVTEEFKAERVHLEAKFEEQRLELESQHKLVAEELKCARDSRQELYIELTKKESELERVTMEIEVLRANDSKTDAVITEENIRLNLENKALLRQLDQVGSQVSDGLNLQRELAEMKQKLEKAEIERRKMHNLIQELKGNIRVMCRIRPLREIDGDDAANIIISPDHTSVSIECNEKMHSFDVDRVFAQSSTQEDVFEEVSQLVQSSVDGYNVCLFSYGQTGSGKTWTMTGGEKEQDWGIIRRSVRKILQDIEEYKPHGWEYNLQASFCEIYNEKLIDLTGNSTDNLDIKMDPVTKKMMVPGLSRHTITNMQDLEQLSREATRNRTTASTDMNDQSSRSHCIFTLYVNGTNVKLNTSIQGSLHLCDLAGSERLDKTNAEGARLGEACAINQSLSCLTTMFLNLSKGNVASFRDSKLTYLLKDCFTGSGKTLMFVNVSPCYASSHESLCSLRFANTVSKVHMGQATKNVSKQAGSEDPGRPLTGGPTAQPIPSYMRSKGSSAAAGGSSRPGTATGSGSSSRPGTARGSALSRPGTGRTATTTGMRR